MRPVNIFVSVCTAILIAGTSSAMAQGNDDLAVGIQGGSAGFGPEVSYSVSPSVTLRGVGNYLAFDLEETVEGVDYDLELDFMSAGGFVDYHPLRNGFHLTLGALYNGNEASLGATAPAGTEIGGFLLPVGAGLSGDLTVDEFSPYLGVGYDTTFTSRQNWSLTVRAGVLYQGEPEVVLRQTSGPNVIPDAELNAEASSIADDLQFLEFYPVVSVGLNYRF